MAKLSDLVIDEANKLSGTKIRLWLMFFICVGVVLCDFFVTSLTANTALLSLVLGTFVFDRGMSKFSNMKYGSQRYQTGRGDEEGDV